MWADHGSELPFRLVEVTSPAGIDFQHNSGAFGGKYLPETLGPGCAFLDYDNDGWQDIILINGMDWPGHKQRRTTMRLYRNNRNGTFTDVTRRAGLDVEMYGLGVAVGDFNNDGFPDLFVSCVGQSRLFHNTGKGTFVDVTPRSGLGRPAGLQHVGAMVRLRSRRPSGSVRLQLREVVARAGCILQPGCQAQILLHARSVPRRNFLAVPQPRRWHIRRRHGQERHLRQQLEIAGRGHAGSRSGWLDRTCSWPTTHSPTSSTATCTTARSRTSRSKRAWRSARTARHAPAWAWMWRIMTTPASPAWWSPISITRCWDFTAEPRAASTSIRRRAPTLDGFRSAAWGSAASFSTPISTDCSICWW